jgi:hypothetical protein
MQEWVGGQDKLLIITIIIIQPLLFMKHICTHECSSKKKTRKLNEICRGITFLADIVLSWTSPFSFCCNKEEGEH